jgi:serine/threonine-protein kinase
VAGCPRCQQALPRLDAADSLVRAAHGGDALLTPSAADPAVEALEHRLRALAPPAAAWLAGAADGPADRQPGTIAEAVGAAVEAGDHRGALPSPGGSAGRFRAALVRGATSGPGEVPEQLRKRLRFVTLLTAVLAAAVVGIGLPFEPRGLLAVPLEAFTRRPHYGLFLAIACLESALAARLSPRFPAGLACLRAMEWLVFAPPVAFNVWMENTNLAVSLPEVVKDPGRLSLASCTPWVLVVVGYGVFIPNTWRRCTAAVGLIALAGFLPNVLVMLGSGAPGRPCFLYLANKALWLGVAAAAGVYGSYRIETLRAEALEARKLGQYRLKERLGAGGMGEVYLAEHVLLRRRCAIKLIRPERAGDPKNLARFEREVRATATLTHPNTVEVFDYGRAEDGTFYYVMEHLPGLTLEQLVQGHGPLSPPRAVHLLRQVCGALREAHAIGLIHRDIKPGNVIVCQRGGVPDVAKLLDFGLVLPQGGGDGERLTHQGALAGTPAYMSPEQAEGREDLDARSDVYGLGALAYFALTGRPVFAGRSAVKVLAAHLYEQPDPLTRYRPDVPADLQAVVLRCLAKDPAGRFPSVEGLEAALAACASAGQWSAEEAAAWWRESGSPGGRAGEVPPDGAPQLR